jgi:thymidylate synthase ThyX
MKGIQEKYKSLIAGGMSVEDARGILPLNIHSPITFSCSYRALLGLLKQRMCVAAQEEWRTVVRQMREQITKKLHPVFAEPIDCACGRFKNNGGFCKTLHIKVKGA